MHAAWYAFGDHFFYKTGLDVLPCCEEEKESQQWITTACGIGRCSMVCQACPNSKLDERLKPVIGLHVFSAL